MALSVVSCRVSRNKCESGKYVSVKTKRRHDAGNQPGDRRLLPVRPDYNGSGQVFKEILCLRFLVFTAFQGDFFKDVPGAISVTHLDVGPRKIKLGGSLIGTGKEIEVIVIPEVVLIDIGNGRTEGLPGHLIGCNGYIQIFI